ncbi:hypothetical protein GHT06_018461 [Daphnia sinensis]|uniref:Peptidase A2 domain-containing protein n=1 Tax=Daphnia sinensis TaxID=1820382 RepID=A0AAD5KN80_9CRUS|nr:hypothetical protein GHT06_018461 [Daphnia sinensis]
MASSRSRNGSITSMPDIGIPDHPNRRDTGVGSQSGSTNPSQRVVLTPEERLRAIEVARVERDTLVVILERQCREIEEMINNRGRRSILKHLKTQMQSRLDEVRDAHFFYNQRLWEAKKPMTDAYSYIVGKEIRVRDVSLQVDHYLDDRRNSLASTCSRATRSQVDEESYFTVDEYRSDDPYPQTYDPVPIHPMDRRDIRCRFETPRPVSPIGDPPAAQYNPGPLESSGRGDPPPPPATSFSSDDWINNRTTPPREASGGFTPNWLMNALPQVKITPFNGDPKEWPTFISSFRDMIHNVVPSDAQRHAFLKQLLTTEKRYGQPQVVARSHLMALMNLPSIRDDDSEELAKLNRTLHGAMHALRTGGYEQDLESGMTLEHVVSRLPPRMRSSWGVKVYRMTPMRATLKDFAKWIDEMVMGELMTRPSSHRSPAPQKEKKSGSHPSESNSSSLKKGVIKKCLYCDNAHSIKTCSTFKDLDVTARVEWVKEKRLCFRCLIGTHRGTECPTEIVCNIGNCGQRHHPLLHGAPRVYPANASTAKNASQQSSKSSDGRAMTIKNRDTAINTSLAIVPVLLQANGMEIETFAFLDPGATVNLIREDVARQLKCKGNAKHVSFGSFHGQDPQFQSTTVSLTVKARDRSFEADLKQVSTVPTQYLKLPCPPKELMEIQSHYPHLKDVKLVEVGEPTILIGAGNQWLHLRLDERLPPVGTDAPFGILTPFGWTCVGDLTLGTQEHDSTVCRATLLLFREKPVSLSGDIQQMFLQVGVKEEDRSALRFLWRPPGSRKRPTVYEMQRQIFGSVSSPFICSQVLRHIADIHREEFPEAAELVYKNFYVDNLLDSFYTEEEASRAVKDSTALLKKGGFHLNQWLSSSRRVLSRVPEGDRNQPRLNLDLEDLPTERTLAVLYDSESDSFIFDVKTDVEASTKRRILSAVSTLYDPLGFLSPVILSAKRILQELWLVGVDWDDQVPELIQHQWNK